MDADSFQYLFSLERFGIKFGLDNIRALVTALGRPDRTFRSLHIAGTNGKGSVTAMAEAALRAGGYRTGRYTSPHLVDLTERFAIDGVPVSRETLGEAIANLQVIVERMRASGELRSHPTFFEATTAVAFELFRRAGVDVAVCEVGLGGRLDATNVLEPVATAITSIDFDHQQYLGDTLAAIATEKAGIIKPGVPVVIGRMAKAARAAVVEIASQRHAPLIDAAADTHATRAGAANAVDLETPLRRYGQVTLALAGEHQVDNACIAVRLLESAAEQGLPIGHNAIVTGLETTIWPGRLELRHQPGGRQLLLDAAHNPAGAAALAAYLHANGWDRQPMVFAAMSDKDVDGVLHALVPAAGTLVVTRASNQRSAEPLMLAERARAVDADVKVLIEASVPSALAAAWTIAPRIIVAGSIFLLGDVIKELDGA